MSDLNSATTRARDLDRSQTCTLLDTAYSDGQLGVDEYEARTAAAMHAATIGDLSRLTADLQIPAHLLELSSAPEAPARRSGLPGRGLVVAVAVVVLLGGFGFGYLLFGRAADSDQSISASGSTPAQPVAAGEPVDTLTADGIREFLRRFEQEFRDTTADDVDLYRDDAVVDRVMPGQPHRSQRWMFTGGFKPWTEPRNRDRDQATVDLEQLDVDRIGQLIADAPGLVRLPSGRIDRVGIRASDAEPRVTVYVEDGDAYKGNVTATLRGKILDVQAA
ncbi:uncharacterized protein DUF1707 [Rhodococcus sp. OK611]|uniref:DUF1707 SHOCT-like domain-containing protein n=1 Tax=unclassified Rhodococcus (in: high G+C Gram-positive bacteria) TaxID=192944 RepID=UPI000BD765A8|nr:MULTISPECIES: DUF1707 domain-containing protein [unclassified Rhodococcus (in: high G+C Gram-positive bacteria)]PTR43234.1 uncharacterized protein DUF1707 [Rhodococcus sp. OK611]SNX91097.1 protein of unknown function [Rhodococcus sp. OK270]